MLAFRQPEAALDELACLRIEFPDLDGVLAAIRELDQTIAVIRCQTACAGKHPVGTLGLGQGVDVEDRLPIRIAGPVALHRCGAPDAANVVGVLPETPERSVASETHRGDPVLRRGDLQRVGIEPSVARIVLQLRQRSVVLGLGPIKGASALDLLHPGVGIIVRHGGAHQENSGEGGGESGKTHGGTRGDIVSRLYRRLKEA